MQPTIRQIHADLLAKKYTCTDLIMQKIVLAKENKHNATVLILETHALEKAALVDQKIARGEAI